MKTSLKATLIATAIAALPFGSHAAGLGAINVFSALGQPLRAEIELQATPQELETLAARVASAGAFRQANVSYSPAMADMKLSIETRGNRSVVSVTSNRPLHEPYLDLLVELQWASGRMLREYTFLLDPAQLAPTRMAAAPTTAPTAAPPAAVAATQPPRPASREAASAAVSEYRVKRGDTLRAIATSHRPPGTNLDQMLIALLQLNPAAFDDGNINRLRAGAILKIPEQADIQAIETAQARREIVAQAADFDAYRNRLAGTVASRPAQPDPTSSRASTGEIAPRVAEPARPAQAQDRVEVSGVSTDAADPARLARLQALEEELVAREQSLEEANSRLAELEQSIRELQRMIELRNQSLAQLQQRFMVGAAPQGSEAADALPALQDLMPAETGDAVPADVQPVVVPVLDATEAPAVAAPVEVPGQEAAVAQSDAPPVRPATPSVVADQTFLQALLEDTRLLAAGGGILALLLGYAGYRIRQRRKAEAGEESPLPVDAYPSEAASVFGSKGGQSVDTGSSSVLQTDFSQSGLSTIDADEGVDPVAEADVYMAYGRDAQAEEILLDALKADASRAAIYLKLLEIYARRKSARQFEATATDLYSRTGGHGDEWAKAAEMGRKLDPANPLYRAKANIPERQSSTDDVAGLGSGRAAAAGIVGAGALGGGGPADEQGAAQVRTGDGVEDLDFAIVKSKEAPSSQLKDAWASPDSAETLESLGGAESEGVVALDGTAPVGTDTASRLPEVDFSVLDFDLGMDAEESADKTGAAKVLPDDAEGRRDGSSAIDEDSPVFDFDIDDNPDVAASALAQTPRHDVEDEALKETLVGEPLLYQAGAEEFDAPELQDAESDAADEASALEWSLDDVPAAEESDLDTTAVQTGSQAAESGSTVTDLEQTEFDNRLLDFDFDLEASPGEPSGAAPVLDLSGINLDLEAVDEKGGGAAPETLAAEVTPPPEVVQEVDTKLDLARAYEEMGDKEGARELIEEVLREGSAEQRNVATRVLERLS